MRHSRIHFMQKNGRSLLKFSKVPRLEGAYICWVQAGRSTQSL